ncbi:hypothetical protein IMAU10574_02629 [Lactiplantibacillus plantarum]|nr:hypothetical protein [Lactiplantibacillus plantarum]
MWKQMDGKQELIYREDCPFFQVIRLIRKLLVQLQLLLMNLLAI